MIMDMRKIDLFLVNAEKAGLLGFYGLYVTRIYTNFGGVLYASPDPVKLAKLVMLARHYEQSDASGMHLAILEKCNYLLDSGEPSPMLWDYDSQIIRDHPKAHPVSLRNWLVATLTSRYSSLDKEGKGIARKFLRWQNGNHNLHF